MTTKHTTRNTLTPRWWQLRRRRQLRRMQRDIIAAHTSLATLLDPAAITHLNEAIDDQIIRGSAPTHTSR